MTYASILNPCQNGNVHMYATTKEIKTMAFGINSKNIEQAFGIQVTFITEIKPQKERFLGKKTVFLVTFAFILKSCQDGNVHTYATSEEIKMMAFRVNSRNIKQGIGIEVTFIMETKLQKEHFLPEKYCLSGDLCVHFESLLGWKCTYVCHD